jgi:hypothetical protein
MGMKDDPLLVHSPDGTSRSESSVREYVMNSNAKRSTLERRLFDGRIEKRLPASVPVYLSSLREPRSGERTTTENVSPHGARTTSKRFWRFGEGALIAPLTGEFTRLGRVVYCEARIGGRFCLGLEFADCSVNWGNHSRP